MHPQMCQRAHLRVLFKEKSQVGYCALLYCTLLYCTVHCGIVQYSKIIVYMVNMVDTVNIVEIAEVMTIEVEHNSSQ